MRHAQLPNVNLPLGGLTFTMTIVAGRPACGSSPGSTCIVTATPWSVTVSWASADAVSAVAAVTATAMAAAVMAVLMVGTS